MRTLTFAVSDELLSSISSRWRERAYFIRDFFPTWSVIVARCAVIAVEDGSTPLLSFGPGRPVVKSVIPAQSLPPAKAGAGIQSSLTVMGDAFRREENQPQMHADKHG